MKITIADASNREEIQQLFRQTFSDSEGAAEGDVIGKLVSYFFTSTQVKDLCFLAK